MYWRLCGMCTRLMQARVEPNEPAPPWLPFGEDVHRRVVHAHALRQLVARVHLCLAEWWCDVDWTTTAASAGIRVASKLILLGSRLDHVQTVPPVVPWAFDVVLERARGLPAFRPSASTRPTAPARRRLAGVPFCVFAWAAAARRCSFQGARVPLPGIAVSGRLSWILWRFGFIRQVTPA